VSALKPGFVLGPGHKPAVIEGWSEDFSYAFYRRIIGKLKAEFRPTLLRDALDAETGTLPLAIVRHDVDLCPGIAARMARLEHELGFRSTYLLLTDSPLYRLEDASTEAHVRKIAALGHEIALHFDLDDTSRLSGRSITELEDHVRAAAARVAAISGQPVQSVSFHRPIDLVDLGRDRIAGLVNAYGADLMRWYLSDSNACWREGDPLASLESPRHSKLQMLVHPIWWGDNHLTRQERLDEFCDSRGDQTADFDQLLFDGIGLSRGRGTNKLERDG
jgi:hypothetical protein